jgi:3-phenylpropionate/cinnamic acid dioxygenase small subunit
MDTTALAARQQIHDLLCRFMLAFDDKDWDLLRTCLADIVRCDYSSLRGTPPGEEAADAYVARRREALSPLAMQHSFSNLLVEVHGDHARARCNFTIHRFAPDFDGTPRTFFHTYGHYRFELSRAQGGFRIRAITQVVLQNHGNPAIHRGAAQPAKGA